MGSPDERVTHGKKKLQLSKKKESLQSRRRPDFAPAISIDQVGRTSFKSSPKKLRESKKRSSPGLRQRPQHLRDEPEELEAYDRPTTTLPMATILSAQADQAKNNQSQQFDSHHSNKKSADSLQTHKLIRASGANILPVQRQRQVSGGILGGDRAHHGSDPAAGSEAVALGGLSAHGPSSQAQMS